MTTDMKLAELPDAWRATSKAAGSTPVAATLNVCAAELESALSQQPSAVGVPKGYVLVPAALAERVQDSLGRFTSDEGSAQADTDTSDDFAACVAAIQPVGQEPVAWYLPSEDGYDSCFRDHRTITSCTGNPWAGWIPLYAAPPAAQADHFPDATKKGAAQAVDLGQFRDCVIEAKESWLQCAENWKGRVRESQYREWVDDCDRLLKLIDQQAGKGNDRAK